MTSVTFKNYAGAVTKRVSYLYDVFDRWVGETIAVPGQAIHQTRFIYDGDQIVLQFDKTGTGNLAKTDLSHRYLWGPAVDQLLADGQGTIRDLAVYNSGTDSTTIANHRVYNAYGVLESQTNAAADCLFGYTGRPFDKASGEQYNGARWYEAVTGRWLSEDPSQFASGDVRSPRIDGVWAGAG
jgi:RHS repeat-associated protein